MSQMLLKYYPYQNDPTYNDNSDGYPRLVLVIFYNGVNIADVCFEFNKPPVLPSDDSRDSCVVHAQLSFRAEGTPIKNAAQAINIAFQTVDCSSYRSIVSDYLERGVPDSISNGYVVIDPSLYTSL